LVVGAGVASEVGLGLGLALVALVVGDRVEGVELLGVEGLLEDEEDDEDGRLEEPLLPASCLDA